MVMVAEISWEEIQKRNDELAAGLPCGCNGDTLCGEAYGLRATQDAGYHRAMATDNWDLYDEGQRLLWTHWNLPIPREQALAKMAHDRK